MLGKIVLLGKNKLNTLGVLNSKALIDSYINMKEEIKNPSNSVEKII